MARLAAKLKAARSDGALPLGRRLGGVKYALLGREADSGLLFRLFLYLILLDTAFIYLKPVLYMMTTMVKDVANLLDPSVIWIPRTLYFGHLQEAAALMNYAGSFGLSATISLSVAVLQTVSCAIAGYAFARLQFPFKKLWFAALLFTFVMPPQVTILPSILIFKELGWLNTFLPMVVPAIFGHGLKGAMFVIIFRQFFSTLPKELEEAARIDGASMFRLFFRVMLPISRSAMIVVFLFAFVWTWNDAYYPAMYMFGADNVPLSISLSRLSANLAGDAEGGGMSVFAEPVKMAASFLILLPVLVIYSFAQRWFVEGVERTGLVE